MDNLLLGGEIRGRSLLPEWVEEGTQEGTNPSRGLLNSQLLSSQSLSSQLLSFRSVAYFLGDVMRTRMKMTQKLMDLHSLQEPTPQGVGQFLLNTRRVRRFLAGESPALPEG